MEKRSLNGTYIICAVLCSLLLIISLLFVFASADPHDNAVSDNIETSASSKEPLTSDFVRAYRLEIDGNFIAFAENETYFENALQQALVAKCAALAFPSCDGCVIVNDISVSVVQCKSEELASQQEIAELLGVREGASYEFEVLNANGEPTPVSIDICRDILITEETDIRYETIYNDVFGTKEDYVKTLESGSNGTLQTTYRSVSINGTEISKETVSESVIKEAQNEIIERGISKDSELYTLSLARFRFPYVGRISSDYGYRYLGGWEFHTGIDLVATSGSCYGHDIYAAGTGIVIAASASGGYGNRIIIEHSDGFRTLYAHLSEIDCKVGDIVFVGQPIGKIGTTGRVTGPHLHFEVRINNKTVDPNYYLYN